MLSTHLSLAALKGMCHLFNHKIPMVEVHVYNVMIYNALSRTVIIITITITALHLLKRSDFAVLLKGGI